MYVYIKTEPGLWTTGFYENGEWHPEMDFDDPENAADRVHYLNGGSAPEESTINPYLHRENRKR